MYSQSEKACLRPGLRGVHRGAYWSPVTDQYRVVETGHGDHSMQEDIGETIMRIDGHSTSRVICSKEIGAYLGDEMTGQHTLLVGESF